MVELWCGKVAVQASLGVLWLRCDELQCRGFAMWGYCGAGELLCGGVTGWGGCTKSQVVRKLPHGAVVMWEFHCGGVAECVGHGGYQTFIYCIFGVF